MISIIFPNGKNLHKLVNKLSGEYEIFIAGKKDGRIKHENVKFVNEGNTTLGVDEINANKLTFIPNSEGYNVYSNILISKIKIYDLLGRNLIYAEPKSKEFSLKTEGINKGSILLIEVVFENGVRKSKKLINY